MTAKLVEHSSSGIRRQNVSVGGGAASLVIGIVKTFLCFCSAIKKLALAGARVDTRGFEDADYMVRIVPNRESVILVKLEGVAARELNGVPARTGIPRTKTNPRVGAVADSMHVRGCTDLSSLGCAYFDTPPVSDVLWGTYETVSHVIKWQCNQEGP